MYELRLYEVNGPALRVYIVPVNATVEWPVGDVVLPFAEIEQTEADFKIKMDEGASSGLI